MEVGLPVDRVVLVRPRHVPNGHARPGHRGVAGLLGAQRVLGVVPLNKQRQRQAELLGDGAREQVHPPAVVVHVDATVQRARGGLARVQLLFLGAHVAQRVLGKVVVVDGVLGSAPHEGGAVHGLAGGAQLRAVLQVEHLPADQDRGARVAGCLHRAHDGVGLDRDVVVHVEDERRVRIVQALVHDAAVAAGPAQVALREDAQLVAERGLRLREVRLVRRVLVALVRHEHVADARLHYRVLGQRVQRVDRVAGAVERGDAHGYLLGLGRDRGGVVKHLLLRRLVGAPRGVGDGGVGLRGDVEPEPAAVLEVFQRERNLYVLVGDLNVGHADAHAVVLRAVDGDGGRALNIQAQDHAVQLRPATPVGSRERVEVGLEADLLPFRDSQGRAVRPAHALLILLRLNEVQRAHVVRFALARHEHARQRLYGNLRIQEVSLPLYLCTGFVYWTYFRQFLPSVMARGPFASCGSRGSGVFGLG